MTTLDRPVAQRERRATTAAALRFGNGARRSLQLALPYLGLLLVGLVFMLPVAWMFLSSFKSSNDVFRDVMPLSWRTFIPSSPTIENYVSIFTTWHFQTYMLNTMLVAAAQVVASGVVCTLAGYVFGRMSFPGRNWLFGLALLTAFVPFDVVVVPLYVVIKGMGLVSTYAALVLPFVANPFGLFLMRQAFIDIPKEFGEAAALDGASAFQVFWRVMLPNVKPALVTLALIQFNWSWNSFIWPLVIMQDSSKQMVQVVITSFRTSANYPLYGELFAAASAVTIPMLILFFWLQRYYVRGMLLSGMK